MSERRVELSRVIGVVDGERSRAAPLVMLAPYPAQLTLNRAPSYYSLLLSSIFSLCNEIVSTISASHGCLVIQPHGDAYHVSYAW